MTDRPVRPNSTAPSKGSRIRSSVPGSWRAYRRRAIETLHAFERSAEAQEWSAVIAIAPISALAAAQAVVARRANVLSRPDDYNTAVELLIVHCSGLPGLDEAVRHMRHLLERKTDVQHGAEEASEPVAEEVAYHASRFIEWVDRQLQPE